MSLLSSRVIDLEQQIDRLKAALAVEQDKVVSLERDNKTLRRNVVSLQVLAEQEEESISNSLLRKIRSLEAQKRVLEEKGQDAQHLSVRIQQLQREKIDLENTLEQESEYAVNRLSKEKMQLEVDKHKLETQLQHCPAHHQLVLDLSEEVMRLKGLLARQREMSPVVSEDVSLLRDENNKLQRKLRHALEKISYLEQEKAKFDARAEVDDERQFNMARSMTPPVLRAPAVSHSPVVFPSSFSPRSLQPLMSGRSMSPYVLRTSSPTMSRHSDASFSSQQSLASLSQSDLSIDKNTL